MTKKKVLNITSESLYLYGIVNGLN